MADLYAMWDPAQLSCISYPGGTFEGIKMDNFDRSQCYSLLLYYLAPGISTYPIAHWCLLLILNDVSYLTKGFYYLTIRKNLSYVDAAGHVATSSSAFYYEFAPLCL